MNNALHIGIITQATNLPGQLFETVKNKPLLQHHIDRLKRTGFEVIIATSNDRMIDFANGQQVKLYRGSETNMLSSYYEAAATYKLDVIIRVTAGCTLIDPHLIRNAVEKYLKFNNTKLYMSNSVERTFARGFDFEILSFQLLEDAYKNAREETGLEQVTAYIRDNKSGNVEFYHVKQPTNNSRLCIAMDTAGDIELIRTLINDHSADALSYVEIEQLLLEQPELIAHTG